MADNLTTTTTVATIPSATVIRTDDLGAAGHAQYVKLLDGTDGSAAVIPGDATNGLDVDVTRLPALVASSAIIGKVGIDQTTPGTTNLVAAGQNGTWNITNASGTVSLPTGAATSAIQTANGVLLGAVTETAPASDTASSGLNGRMQRLAQRVTSLIALVPAALTGSGNFKVSIQEYGSGSAAAATTDAITAKLATDSIQNGLTALTPKFAKIAASSSGNNTLVAAVTSKKIRVLAYNFMGAGAVNAKFQDGASGTDLSGLKYIAAAGGGICAPFNPVGWFEGTATTLLNLNLSGAVAVGGEIVYVEV